MHYVCKKVKIEYGHIENQKRFLFIQISLNGTSLKKDNMSAWWTFKSRRINILASSSGDHHFQQLGPLEDIWILNPSNSSHAAIFFNSNRLLQVFDSSNPFVNLSCPFQIFNLDSSFHSFFKRSIASLHQSLSD